MNIPPGLYEQVVNAGLEKELEELDSKFQAMLVQMDPAESHFILAQYLGQFLKGLLGRITDSDKLEKQTAACNRLIECASVAPCERLR